MNEKIVVVENLHNSIQQFMQITKIAASKIQVKNQSKEMVDYFCYYHYRLYA